MLAELSQPVGKRLLALIPVLFGISLLVFILNAVALGDPARAMLGQRGDPELIAQIREEYALDRPLWVQYWTWMARLLQGNLGRSYHQQRPVSQVVAERFPATFKLAIAATLIAVGAGLTMGIAAAIRPASVLDHLLMGAAVIGISTPVFWLGLMLSLLFAVWLGWFPVSGYGDGALTHLVLPALTLGALHTGTIARMARSSLVEVIRQDYIQAARAKGLAELAVIGKHALKNALIPVVTVIGIGLADLLVGAPLTETVFAWPGLGRMLVAAVGQRDLPVVMGAVLVFAVIYVLGNLLVDLAYLLIDPRIRRE
ncbi:MAG: ABC transporter permease [Candidatus Rokubacteria bacterium]|nr:ABC transporter permease [Candidatus Rokubacteria bacterium]